MSRARSGCLAAVALAAAAWGGCGGNNNQNCSGSSCATGDMAGANVDDLAGVDLFGVDLTGVNPGADMTVNPSVDMTFDPNADMTVVDLMPRSDGPIRAPIAWRLYNCDNTSMQGCGYSATCDQAAATMITFTVTSESTNATLMSKGSCPTGTDFGMATVDIPNDDGPFTITAVLDGVPASNSEMACHWTDPSLLEVHIYYQGCDMGFCQMCT